MRTCVIDIPGLSNRLLDALPDETRPGWLNELIDLGRSTIRPVLPAVTMTVQATYTTGHTPAGHGMIANGLPAYRLPDIRDNLDLSNFEKYRCAVSFWEQSNMLLTEKRIWKRTGRTAATLMLQSSMDQAADVVVTPKPEHTPDGKTISMCWSAPTDLYNDLREQLGEFPLHHYWGPLAGIKSSDWIAAAARLVWEQHPCDLQWVYIPQMDYDLQKLGPGDERCLASLGQTLGLLTPLVEKVLSQDGRILLLSEYGMTPVSRSVAPNAHLAAAGLLTLTDSGEVDYDNSRAFAMVDHQVAHVYTADDTATAEVRSLLESMPEVDVVYEGGERASVGLDTPRAGDLVAFSHTDAWFEYRWWDDWSKAPAYAWTVDIHRKPGYDPTEMFFDPVNKRIAADKPQHVKGSHGALPKDKADWPVLLGSKDAASEIDATDVAELL
ncbi:MAG: hypothetical protein GC159_23900 [Phycisphaera sp.]|nr:hypothetical protein [Phycisphaera sp.]